MPSAACLSLAAAALLTGFADKSWLIKPEDKQVSVHIAQGLPADPYGSNPHGKDPHGSDLYVRDPHDEYHDAYLPANEKDMERRATTDPYGGKEPFYPPLPPGPPPAF